jgi:hypothetical protein
MKKATFTQALALVLAGILPASVFFGAASCKTETDPTPPAITLPALTGTVNTSGGLEVGSTLTASLSGSNTSGPITFEWYDENGILIATGPSYASVEANVDKPITVKASDSNHSGFLTSAPLTVLPKTYERTVNNTFGKKIIFRDCTGSALSLIDNVMISDINGFSNSNYMSLGFDVIVYLVSSGSGYSINTPSASMITVTVTNGMTAFYLSSLIHDGIQDVGGGIATMRGIVPQSIRMAFLDKQKTVSG